MSAIETERAGPPAEPPPGSRFRRHVTTREAVVDLWRSRELIRTLVERDLRVRYKQTLLGFGWALFGPVVLMLVFTLFFQRAGHFDTSGVPYALFSYTALVPWGFFSEAVGIGSGSLLSNVSLLNKVYCPREVFPIAATVTSAFDAAVSSVVLLVLFAVYEYPPKLAALWLPLLAAIAVAFTLGVVLFTSSVLIYLRDVRYVVPLAVQVGMFATPVAYALSVIPASLRPGYAVLDPLGPIIDSVRRTVLHGQSPEWGLVGIAAAASAVWLAGGYRVFKRLETGFADIA